MGREEHCKQISLVYVGSARRVWTALGLPQLMAVACAFPVDTAQAPGCCAGELSKAGPGWRALPRTKPLRFSGTPQRHRLSCACILCPSQVQAAQATRCLASTHSSGAMRLITSLTPAARFPGWQRVRPSQVCCASPGELISGGDRPGRCQPSRIPGRLG